jgi:hypothetical protein
MTGHNVPDFAGLWAVLNRSRQGTVYAQAMNTARCLAQDDQNNAADCPISIVPVAIASNTCNGGTRSPAALHARCVQPTASTSTDMVIV